MLLSLSLRYLVSLNLRRFTLRAHVVVGRLAADKAGPVFQSGTVPYSYTLSTVSPSRPAHSLAFLIAAAFDR